jgi:hypothetical protein
MGGATPRACEHGYLPLGSWFLIRNNSSVEGLIHHQADNIKYRKTAVPVDSALAYRHFTVEKTQQLARLLRKIALSRITWKLKNHR